MRDLGFRGLGLRGSKVRGTCKGDMGAIYGFCKV